MKDNEIIPGWISETEMQTISGFKATTLWKLRKDGKLKFSKIGNHTFYPMSSFLRLLEQSINN